MLLYNLANTFILMIYFLWTYFLFFKQLSSITSRHYALSHCETRHRSSSGEFVKLHVNLKSGNYLSTDDTKSCAKSPRRLPTHSLQNSTKETCTDKNPNPNPNTITNLKRKEEEIDIESKLFNGNVIPKVSIRYI